MLLNEVEEKNKEAVNQSLRGTPASNRNERQSTSRKCPVPRRSRGPHHSQEGPTQVQAEADSHVQEQGSQTRPEGLRRRHPRHGGPRHRHHSGVPMGGLRRHGAQRLGQIRHHLSLLPSCPSAPSASLHPAASPPRLGRPP